MQISGGEALVRALLAHGVRDLFFIPGTQLDWVVDALRGHAGAIARYVPRHEQSTTYMADGYFRSSGQPGVAMVVPGPGVLNAGAGLATAYACNARVLLLAAQIHSAAIGRGYGQLHEIADQSGLIAGLTKWSHRVHTRGEIGEAVAAAFRALHAGRPRPVGLELPCDLLRAQGDDASSSGRSRGAAATDCERGATAVPGPDSRGTSRLGPGMSRAAVVSAHMRVPSARQQGAAGATETPPVADTPPLDERLVVEAARLIDAASFPVLYAGGGVLAAEAGIRVQALAEKLGAAVVMSDNGRGALSDRHPLAMTTLAGRALFEAADLVIVIGSRFMEAMTAEPSWPAGRARFIHINIDVADLGPPRTPELAIHADARDALEVLIEHVAPRRVLGQAQAEALRDWAQTQIDAVMPQAAYVRALRAAMPEDAIFVNELTQVGYLARIAFPVYAPRTFIGPGYQGTLGYALPTALGAAVGAPGKRVVAVSGDGGFGWSLQELATARRYRLPVTLVLFNDGHFGNVRAIQKRLFGAEECVVLENPDFQLLARAFGVPSVVAASPQALEAELRASLGEAGPVLIEVPVGEMPSPWHLLRLRPMSGLQGPPTPPLPPLSGGAARS